ncbi:MAG: prolyl oligopeptidase family serine peptidase [Rhodospirillaceae bacterium]
MSYIPELHGPTQETKSGGPAKQLVIFCHGVGADGTDLIGLAPYFARVLPDAKFVSPNAPQQYDLAPFGYQWFSLTDPNADRLPGVQAAAPILDHFIDQQMATHGLSEAETALVGFSQGTMMSLHVGLRREKSFAGIIGYSGRLVGPELLASELKSRPPVMLMHGDADTVVPPSSLKDAVSALAGVGIDATFEMRPDLGHGLDDRCIMMGMDFLATCFGVPLPQR